MFHVKHRALCLRAISDSSRLGVQLGIQHVDDAVQVLDRGELDCHLSLASPELDLDVLTGLQDGLGLGGLGDQRSVGSYIGARRDGGRASNTF